jgi:hypothetical protein
MTDGLYKLFHDFAGPVATIIAATAALVVTWRFNSRQANIAEQQAATARQQADIASMRLQYDLFERRFRVYNEAKTLLVYLQRENILSEEVLDSYMRGTVDSLFFLDKTVFTYLNELKDQAIRLRGIQQRLREPLPEETTITNREIQKRNREGDVNQEPQLLNWFHDQFPVLVDKFKPFLALQESPLRRSVDPT